MASYRFGLTAVALSLFFYFGARYRSVQVDTGRDRATDGTRTNNPIPRASVHVPAMLPDIPATLPKAPKAGPTPPPHISPPAEELSEGLQSNPSGFICGTGCLYVNDIDLKINSIFHLSKNDFVASVCVEDQCVDPREVLQDVSALGGLSYQIVVRTPDGTLHDLLFLSETGVKSLVQELTEEAFASELSR